MSKKQSRTIISQKLCKLCGSTAKVRETPVLLKVRIKGKLKEVWTTINTCIWCDAELKNPVKWFKERRKKRK